MSLSKNHFVAAESIGTMLFAGAAETYPYVDGKRGTTSDGIRIDVLLSDHEMERLSVKIAGGSAMPEIKPLTPVEFTDLKVTAYVSDKWLKFKAVASGVKPLDRGMKN